MNSKIISIFVCLIMVTTSFGMIVPAEKFDTGGFFDFDISPVPEPTPVPGGGIETGLAPVAVAGADRVLAVDELTIFDGSKSYDPDGTIIEYHWDFGWGAEWAEGEYAMYSYPVTGTFITTLTVTDAAGFIGTDTVLVLVRDDDEDSYAEHLLDELMEDVEELELPRGIKNSLVKKLESVESALAKGTGGKSAQNKLEAFINEVEAQMGKKLDGEVGFELINSARVIITELEGSAINLMEDANTDWLHLLTEEYYTVEAQPIVIDFELSYTKFNFVTTTYEPGFELDLTAYEYSLAYIEAEYIGGPGDPVAVLDDKAISLSLPDWWHHIVISTPGELAHSESGTYVVAIGAPGNSVPGTYEYSLEMDYAEGALEGELIVVHEDSLSVKAKEKYEDAREAIAGIFHWDWTLDTDQVHGLAPGDVLNLPGYGWVSPQEAMDILLEEFHDCNSEEVSDLCDVLVLLHGVESPHFTFAPGIAYVGMTFYGDLRITDVAAQFILVENCEVHGDIIIEDVIVNDITLRANFARDVLIESCITYGEILVEGNEVLGDLDVIMLWDIVLTFNGNTVGNNLQVLIGNIPGGLPAGGFITLTINSCTVGAAGAANSGNIIVTLVSNWIATSIVTILTNNYVYNDIIVTEADNTVFWGVINTWVDGNVVFNDIMLYEPLMMDTPVGGPRVNVGNTIVSWGGIIKTVQNNRVGRHVGIFVYSTQMPVTGMISINIFNNRAGGTIGSQVGGTNQLMDLNTQVLNNQCMNLLVMCGMNGYWFMRDIITNVQNNQVGNDIWISIIRNNVWRDLVTWVNSNGATRMMGIDIDMNWPRPYLVVTPSGVVTQYIGFSQIAVVVRFNHVVREDLIVDVTNNRMTYNPAAQTSIFIEQNGAGRDVKFSITDNDIDFGTININIMINRANNDMEVTVMRNALRRAPIVSLVVSSNTGRNMPKINVEPLSWYLLIIGNVVFDPVTTGTDTDGDGLSNNYEWIIGTSPTNPDTDNDGLFDGWDDADGSRTWDWTDANGNGIMDQGEFERFGEVGDPGNAVPNDPQGRYQGGIATLFTVITAWGMPLEDPSPIRQDVYVEVDFMVGMRIQQVNTALNLIPATYGKEAITLHIDAGWQIGPANPVGAFRGGGEQLNVPPNNLIVFASYTPAGVQKTVFDMLVLKNGEQQDINGDGVLEPAHLYRNRLGIFHYCIMGHSFWQPAPIPFPPPIQLAPGVGEMPGDDFFVGIGTMNINWRMAPPAGFNWGPPTAVAIAGVFEHELGHNLALPHQPDPTNPAAAGTAWGHQNYRSVMSTYSPTLPPPFPGGDQQSYVYNLLDYSDGTNGPFDFNDYGILDLSTGINTWQNHNW
ncbi:MAG: PKD domain-containing protein [Thermoplasmata archaeon]|nr:MAG: PKD domain-containing protein [Thermoplasmata archaeon]